MFFIAPVIFSSQSLFPLVNNLYQPVKRQLKNGPGGLTPPGRLGRLPPHKRKESGKLDGVAEFEGEGGGGVAAVDGDFEVAGGAEDGEGLAGGDFLVELLEVALHFVRDADGADALGGRFDVGDGVAEVVDVDDFAAQQSADDLWLRPIEADVVFQWRPE